jgi:hypothetical protein
MNYSYMIPLPVSIGVHNVFHVSLLKKYLNDPNHVIDWTMIKVDHEGEFWVELVCILDQKLKFLRNQEIDMVKV